VHVRSETLAGVSDHRLLPASPRGSISDTAALKKLMPPESVYIYSQRNVHN